MKAEDLIAMASAHGVDMVAAAQSRSNMAPPRDTHTRTRLGLRIVELLPGPGSGAYAKETPRVVEPEWTAADAAHALAGLDTACGSRYPALAALFAFAGHGQHYHVLLDGLLRVAFELRREQRWPIRVLGVAGTEISYLDKLSEMVLADDKYPGALDYAPEPRPGQPSRRGELRVAFCDVTPAIWRTQLADRYSLLQGVWTEWLNTAARWTQRRLREGDPE